MKPLIDLTGQRFGRLVVVARAPSENRRTRWHCLCDCGTEKTVRMQSLTTRNPKAQTRSCGCLHRDITSRKDAASRDPAHLMLWDAKKRAKAKGVSFSITADDTLIPEKCPLLGIPLARSAGFRSASSPSLDRVRPELGYVPGNVWVISYRANMIKNDASLEELKQIAAALEARCAI